MGFFDKWGGPILAVFVVALLAGQFSAEAKAEEYTAQKWASDCRAGGFDTGFCFGYARSAADHDLLISMTLALAKGGPIAESRAHCLPSGVTLGQTVEIARRYVAENPAEWHKPAMYVLRDAWAKAFPCPAK